LTELELATAEGFVGNLDECQRGLDQFFRAASSPDKIAGYSTSAMAHTWCGYVLQYKGHMEKAAEHFARAQEISAAAGNKLMHVLLVTWGMLAFGEARGELPRAMELAAEMMRVAEESGVPHMRVGARGGLARAHALRGEWREAARLFEEGIALANGHSVYLEGEGQDLASFAHAYVEIGEPERAREAAERGLALVR
jgi:tetratricopeptide (TPR) repeat protein